MKNIARFKSTDQTLTIAAVSGKSGFNVKASVKTGSGKGAPKAQTGCRQRFQTEAEARSAFDKLVSEARARGWSEMAVQPIERNAFSSIPAPAKAAKASKTA
jgi:predicted DNA-binding WGR domain protein